MRAPPADIMRENGKRLPFFLRLSWQKQRLASTEAAFYRHPLRLAVRYSNPQMCLCLFPMSLNYQM